MELTHLCSTGIFRVAGAGLSALWGSSSPADQDADEPPPPDPEVKLRLRHGFRDSGKSASVIEVSPDEKYSAVVDDQNRVILLDNYQGVVTHMWKGYHRAQVPNSPPPKLKIFRQHFSTSRSVGSQLLGNHGGQPKSYPMTSRSVSSW